MLDLFILETLELFPEIRLNKDDAYVILFSIILYFIFFIIFYYLVPCYILLYKHCIYPRLKLCSRHKKLFTKPRNDLDVIKTPEYKRFPRGTSS